jgi:hypothetical protein
MTHFETLQVHLELAGATVFVGHAQFQRRRGALASTTFQYDLGYLAHPDAYPMRSRFEPADRVGRILNGAVRKARELRVERRTVQEGTPEG